VTENEVATQIVDAAYRMHTSLGPGLLESVYEVVLAYELENRGLRVVRQQADYRLFRRMPERWLGPRRFPLSMKAFGLRWDSGQT
jgi:hypothetical protein